MANPTIEVVLTAEKNDFEVIIEIMEAAIEDTEMDDEEKDICNNFVTNLKDRLQEIE